MSLFTNELWKSKSLSRSHFPFGCSRMDGRDSLENDGSRLKPWDIIDGRPVTFQNYAIKHASTMRQSLQLDAAFQGIQADIPNCVSLHPCLTPIVFARSLLSSGQWESLIDPHLNGDYMKEEMEIMISVARLCLAHSSSRRPTMKTILTLDYSGKKLVIPFFFFFGKPRADVDNPKGKPQLKSINPSATRHLTEKLLA
ncbi:hypothetical protein D5086_009175 [Populus alba]|uniref:Uncharacterized protein n=1 Tax=Populus alba TaxID=43335 RepID=A0ACC4CHZ5_POPAL